MDLRQFLKRLEEVGEIKTIPEETHWSLEAAALCAMTNRVGGPALFFPLVKGYPSGYGLAGSLVTGPGTMFYRERTPWGRIAAALRLDKEIGYEELMEVLIERRQHPIPPLRVSTGPCKEVVARGHLAGRVGPIGDPRAAHLRDLLPPGDPGEGPAPLAQRLRLFHETGGPED